MRHKFVSWNKKIFRIVSARIHFRHQVKHPETDSYFESIKFFCFRQPEISIKKINGQLQELNNILSKAPNCKRKWEVVLKYSKKYLIWEQKSITSEISISLSILYPVHHKIQKWRTIWKLNSAYIIFYWTRFWRDK